jgi:hypothetical protein
MRRRYVGPRQPSTTVRDRALENRQRVEVRRRSAAQSCQLDGHEELPAFAGRGLPGGIFEVAIVDQRHSHHGDRKIMDRAVRRFGAADDAGRLHVIVGVSSAAAAKAIPDRDCRNWVPEKAPSDWPGLDGYADRGSLPLAHARPGTRGRHVLCAPRSRAAGDESRRAISYRTCRPAMCGRCGCGRCWTMSGRIRCC